MIQELFGGGASTGLLGERKISLSGVLETHSPSPSISPSPSPSPSSSTTTTAPTSSAPQTTSDNQNLRCPRCDSANTKFCYYNNYNLTQPRHFCKTCRRYWTKGGALRNVPIGGGCRKNKSTTVVASPVGKAISTSKLKTVVMSSDIGKPGFVSGFDHELPSNPILWGGPSQSSLLALLRATTQSPTLNPNYSSNPVNVKDEGFMNIGSSSMATSDASLNGRNFGFDSMGQVPSIGMCSSFWRNNISNQAPHDQQQQNGGFVLGEIQNTTGMNSSQLYQRLRSSPVGSYYHSDQTSVILGNVASSSSPSSTILESAPVAGGELGFWNPDLSWSDLSTVNGAYP